jgi:hypothetical protein
VSVVTAKRLDASRITGGTHLITRQPPYFAGVHRLAVESSGIGGGGRASARLPCWLNIRIARIGRGFHGLSHGRGTPRWRGNPCDARGAARGGTGGGPAGPVLAATPVTHVTATAATAALGTNLLLNPEAAAGATSAQGWDAVTIPGWQVAGGLPTVVRYGTPGFPETAKSWPGNRGNLFAGGAGGAGKLVQLSSVTPNARYDIAGWLGRTTTSAAELTVRFTGASGRILAAAAIGPAGKQAKPVLYYRQAAGTVPAGATRTPGSRRPRLSARFSFLL